MTQFYTIIVFVFRFSHLEYEVYESDGSVEIEIFFIRGIPEDYINHWSLYQLTMEQQ